MQKKNLGRERRGVDVHHIAHLSAHVSGMFMAPKGGIISYSILNIGSPSVAELL